MDGVHALWLGALALIALLLFGPSRLPELGAALGSGIRGFRKALDQTDTPRPPAASSEEAGHRD